MLLAGAAGASLIATGTAAGLPNAAAARTPLQVVAAENFWGSLAAQLGGDQAQVFSIVTDPNADPHEYESSSADARRVAQASLVIVNGAGYDSWAQLLLAAQPASGRRLLDVAQLLGQGPGANPHFWYQPDYVLRVVSRIAAEYRALRPSSAAYFAARLHQLQRALQPYRARLAAIQRRDRGEQVAATESIFVYLAHYLKLDLVTPTSFMKAVSEGVDPPVSSVAAFQSQLQRHSFRTLVYNVQTVTPLTSSLEAAARREHIPVVGISETVRPRGASFEAWMDHQLSQLASALTQGRH